MYYRGITYSLFKSYGVQGLGTHAQITASKKTQKSIPGCYASFLLIISYQRKICIKSFVYQNSKPCICLIYGLQTVQISLSSSDNNPLAGCNLHWYKGIRLKITICDGTPNETKKRFKPGMLPHVRSW